MNDDYGAWRADWKLLLFDRLNSPDWVVTRGLFLLMLITCVWLLGGSSWGVLFFSGQGAWWLCTKWFPGWVERQTRWDNAEQFFTEET